MLFLQVHHHPLTKVGCQASTPPLCRYQMMRSTSLYCIAVYDTLEEAGFEVYLDNARDMKILSGRRDQCPRKPMAGASAHLWAAAGTRSGTAIGPIDRSFWKVVPQALKGRTSDERRQPTRLTDHFALIADAALALVCESLHACENRIGIEMRFRDHFRLEAAASPGIVEVGRE